MGEIMDMDIETVAAERFLKILNVYRDKENKAEAFPLYDEIFESLIATWTRKQLFLFLFKLMRDHASLMVDEVDDYFDGWYTAVAGDCGPASIVKFPGDPDDPDELAAQVRSERLNGWLKAEIAKERAEASRK